MRKIIDGKAYDTETADLICSLSPVGYSRSDFRWEDTSLYRTKKGRFFIAGEGGALSRWARSIGDNGHGPGDGLTLVDDDEARSLVERHGDGDDYTRLFGEPEEG